MNIQDVYDELRHARTHEAPSVFLPHGDTQAEAEVERVPRAKGGAGESGPGDPRNEPPQNRMAKRFELHENKGAVWNYCRVLGALVGLRCACCPETAVVTLMYFVNVKL